jgi:hypothetical protein
MVIGSGDAMQDGARIKIVICIERREFGLDTKEELKNMRLWLYCLP